MAASRMSRRDVTSKLLVGLIALVSYALGAEASPQKPTDIFTSPCGAFLPDPPPQGYKRWSSPTTWPDGVVPGVGAAAGANATIPCGAAVLLDVPALSLGLLRVMGALKFADDAAVGDITLAASFVLVEGTFIVGTEAQQFSRRATITITPNTQFGRAPLLYTSSLPAEPAFPRNLGHKAFAVVGGQVNFHGLPGPRTMPTWCRLSATALAGDSKIYVDQMVAGVWPLGATIGLASTDYNPAQAERFTITAVAASGSGAVITLDRPLAFMHWGGALDDGFGGSLEQRGEVALLSRNIVMTATQEPAPYALEGGHFIVFFTQVPQYVEGLQSVRMGQQGTLGRYPIHMHFVGNQQGGTYIRKNSIMDTNQRCVIIHASFNVTVYDNVAFNTRGHCFIIEEGGETGNVFDHNLGMLTMPVTQLIAADETDDKPSTFWITNTNNFYVNNVAAGCTHAGFWFEARSAVRGLSLQWALINTTVPTLTTVALFSGNVAHSNTQAGIRTYPSGLRPRPGATYKGWELDGPNNIFSNLTIYKNGQHGIFVHSTDRLTIKDSTFSDNGIGVMLNRDQSVTVQASKFLALSNNIGNPDIAGCRKDSQWSYCRPLVGCKMPLLVGQVGRSVGSWRDQPTIGVGIDQSRRDEFGGGATPNQVVGSKFANYDPTCRQAAAIALQAFNVPQDYFNAGHSVQGLTFDSISNRIWVFPPFTQYSAGLSVFASGEQAQFYTLKDVDGSIIGSPGFIVANNSKILPLAPQTCSWNAKWNAYGCPGTCYRTLSVDYLEPGYNMSTMNKKGDWSSLVITRVQDGQVLTLDGNLFQTEMENKQAPTERFFLATLLAGATYQITVIPGARSPVGFVPAGFTINFQDGTGCGQGIKIQLPASPGQQWGVNLSDDITPIPCAGGPVVPATAATWQILCQSGTGVIEATLGGLFTGVVVFSATAAPTTCLLTMLCNLVSSGSEWSFDDSGANSHPKFANPAFTPSTWKTGRGLFAYLEYSAAVVRTPLLKPDTSRFTYYFRKWFNVKDSACISKLTLQVSVGDGIAIFLNNKEMLRYNVPAGVLSNATKASSHVEFLMPGWPPRANWTGAELAPFLAEGPNLLAVEVHSVSYWEWEIGFDMRLLATAATSGCAGAVVSPEVCDGVDNDNNGKIDDGPDGNPMTQACKTVCGAGFETCILGTWQNCTAIAAVPETCNGKDDNCDGFIDNGLGQLDCQPGMGCFSGKCLPVGNLTAPQPVWVRNASTWQYYDLGTNYDAENPQWRLGVFPLVGGWGVGAAPLGYAPNTSTTIFGSVLKSVSGKSATLYFLKSFALTAADLALTYSIDMSVRRDDGALVFVNGNEVMRSNMPPGPVTYRTFATYGTQPTGTWMPKWPYFPCTTCSRSTASLLQVGVNWIAAEVHQASLWSPDAVFDLELTRNVVQTCASAMPITMPLECILQPTKPTIFWEASSTWKYLDGYFPPPTADWTLPAYNDATWLSGNGALGYGTFNLIKTRLKNDTAEQKRVVTYYFRKTFDVPDGPCFYSLLHSVLANDGAVVYLNGLEVHRQRMPAGAITNATFAAQYGTYAFSDTQISGGWLKAGANVMAVELHQFPTSFRNIFFDSALRGFREGATCLPGPEMVPPKVL